MGISYPKLPVVGVGAVVLDGPLVLLVKRGQPPMRGMWSIPGGVVELGESLRQALMREVREETGLNVSVGPLVDTIESIVPDAAGRIQYHYILFDYLCALNSGSLQAGGDATQAAWFSWRQLAELNIWPPTLALINKARILAGVD